jgi:hypothetical protein
VTFLALLDLLKSEDVRAEQSCAFGDIMLEPVAHAGSETAASG